MAAAMESQAVSYSSEEILKEVRNFVKGSTYETKVPSEELAKSALFLLRTLPSARHAVLEHLCNVFDEAVYNHIVKIDVDGKVPDVGGPNLDAVIEDIQEVLMTFVKSNPDAWAPIISAWSIELLGQVSSKYSNHRGVPDSTSLNELLRLWMTCLPTKVLIEIASECFACMVSRAPDVCIDALLEASVKHSPHFDWVVAHIGSCFPTTIITRVLMCGLKDFHLHGNSQSDVSTRSEEKIPKMASVVSILGHLASQHGQDIRKALHSLFKESLQPEAGDVLSSVVPFLLHLASMSPLLLRVITSDLVHTVTSRTLNTVARQFRDVKASALQDSGSLITLAVHLLTKTDMGANRVIKFLLDTAIPHSDSGDMETEDTLLPAVQATASTIMEKLLLDLQRIVQAKPQGVELPLLQSLQNHVPALVRQMVSSRKKVRDWLCHLLACVGGYCGESCSADILQTVLCVAANAEQLSTFVEILKDVQVRFPDVLAVIVARILDSLEPPSVPPEQPIILKNLQHLAHWQRVQAIPASVQLIEMLRNHLPSLILQLYSQRPEVAKVTVEILSLIILQHKDEVSVVLKLCAAVVNFFFQSLTLKDTCLKCHCAQMCLKYMRNLSKDSIPQRTLLRFVLEAAVSKEFAPVFGCKVVPPGVNSVSVERPQVVLLEENKQHSLTISTPQSHCSVFYAGVIGQGLKPLPRPSPYTKEEQIHNKQMLMDVLWACSFHDTDQVPNTPEPMDTRSGSGLGSKPTIEPASVPSNVAKILASLLVELVTPDVLYNVIPWPEEEYMKITVERDLLIYKKFEETPVLWDIMELIASGPGAMAVCSPLLRGVTATLVTYWEACRDKSACNVPHHLMASCRLMECMRKGNILPTPLCHVGELFSLLSPFEVYLLLMNTWRYLKENPPSTEPPPNKLTGCDPYFTDVIRAILHKNIDKLGHLYSRFLPPSIMAETSST